MNISTKDVFGFILSVNEQQTPAENILNEVELEYGLVSNPTGLFSQEHRKYYYRIWRDGRPILSSISIGAFQCNPRVFNVEYDSMKREILRSLFADMDAFLRSESYEDFAREFGCDVKAHSTKHTYDACKSAYLAIKKMFTRQEREILREYFEAI